MKFVIFLLVFFSTQALTADKTEFGAPITMKDSISIDEAIQKSKSGDSGELLIAAKVQKVCKSKGCWLGFQSEEGDVRVTFKDYGFFVPFEIEGKEVLVQGTIKKKTMTLDDTKHFVEDEGGDPDKVTEPRTEYRVIATGVKIKP